MGCSGCHTPLQTPDQHGRTWARSRGSFCADCHEDPHAGQFRIDNRTDCERCHRSAVSFLDLSFRHDLDSRFRLGDAHSKLACSECHKPVEVGAAMVIRYRPLERECVSCHGAHDNPLRRRRGK